MKKQNLGANGSVVSEIEIVYKNKAKEKTKIKTSLDAYNVFKSVYDFNKIEHKEMFYCLYLNRANTVLGVLLISEGGTKATIADPKIIFQGALKLNASAVILSHNHPSGNMKASSEDISLTRRVKDGGKLLGIDILDHLIVGPEENVYLSMSDEGIF